MKILLINIDSKIPNLALKKIELYHKQKGDTVVWNYELDKYTADKIYVSCVFTKNLKLCKEWENISNIGGTGYDIEKKLPDEIENMKPKINWGFTTRGCVRKCSFCFVPKKEGEIRVVGDVYDIWDGRSKGITIMDNNILALPEHFKMICKQLRKENLIVDFNQGLDLRLLTDELSDILKKTRHKEYKFSWDNQDNLGDKLKWLYSVLGRCTIFVLCGYKSSFEQDLKKFEYIRECKHNAYAMRYETIANDKKYIKLARWVNQHHIFRPYTFKQFIEADKQYHGDLVTLK